MNTRLQQRSAIPKRFCAPLCLVLCIAVVSCTSENKDEKPIQTAAMTRTAPFTLPSDLVALKTDIRRIDLQQHGYEDALVTVYPKDSMGARLGFEALQIFEFDTTKQVFVRSHEEKVFYGKSLDVRDLDGDGTQEICIRTDGGGNSEIASIGMTVLKKRNGRYARIVGFDSGNPEIILLPNGTTSVNAVLMNGEYVPEYLPRTEAVTVVDSIIVLAQNAEESEKLRRKFFDESLAKAEQRYADAKNVLKSNRSEPAAYNAYTEAVTVLRLMSKSSRSASLAAYISTERAYWRAMLPARYQQALGDVFVKE
jgi:hypothetical protein